MALWSVIGKGIEDDVRGKTFAATLNTDNNSWTVQGPNVDRFFATKSGVFKFAALPENGTQFVDAGARPREVAFFQALNASSAVGSKGTGRASEKGVNFDWTLDSK